VAKGYFKTVQEVFDALLRRGGPAYVPQPKLSPEEAVDLVHKAGGIAVLAHPSEISDSALPEKLLEMYDFDGIEVYHPSADEAEQNKWLALAKKHNLLVSGGSDFHGIPDRFPTELGIFEVHWQNVAGVIQYKER
jgi:predicted metal-dependent phosphoesterase TrpH